MEKRSKRFSLSEQTKYQMPQCMDGYSPPPPPPRLTDEHHLAVCIIAHQLDKVEKRIAPTFNSINQFFMHHTHTYIHTDPISTYYSAALPALPLKVRCKNTHTIHKRAVAKTV
jgi:hypothetical protein